MKKDIDDICLPITSEEFCNIMNLWISPDQECKILAKELLRPFVYEINESKIWLTKDFFFKHKYNGWFEWSNRSMSGPIPIWRKWKLLIENSNKQ